MLLWSVKSLHLLAAMAFFGTLFFQLWILPALLRDLQPEQQTAAQQRVAQRTRQILHWVVVLLYGAGIYLAWQYRGLLDAPLSNSAGLLLTVKISLALSVIGHYLALAWLRQTGRLDSTRERRMHMSVLVHLLLIVLLAKGLFVFSF